MNLLTLSKLYELLRLYCVCPDRPDWVSTSSCLTGGYMVNDSLVPFFPPAVKDASVPQPGQTLLLMDAYAGPLCVDHVVSPPGSPDTSIASVFPATRGPSCACSSPQAA